MTIFVEDGQLVSSTRMEGDFVPFNINGSCLLISRIKFNAGNVDAVCHALATQAYRVQAQDELEDLAAIAGMSCHDYASLLFLTE